MDEKTKEIVERLHQLARNYADAVDSYHDDKRLTAEDSMYFVAASLITRLSERVEELETALSRIADHHSNVEPYDTDEACWDHIANLVLIAERVLLSKREGRG